MLGTSPSPFLLPSSWLRYSCRHPSHGGVGDGLVYLHQVSCYKQLIHEQCIAPLFTEALLHAPKPSLTPAFPSL